MARMNHARGQRGMTLIEVIVAIAIGLILMTLVAGGYTMYLTYQTNQLSAQWLQTWQAGAKQWISDNSASLLASSGGTATQAQLNTGGYFGTGFAATDSYGESATLHVIVVNGKLQGLVCAGGGQVITGQQQHQIAGMVGLGGGWVASGAPTVAVGKAWGPVTLSTYGIASGGCQMVAALFVTDLATVDDSLHRHATAGLPQLNQMATAIDMNGNDITGGGHITANGATLAGGSNANSLAVGSAVFYGDGANSAIRQPGSLYIQHLDGSSADIAEVGNIGATGNINAAGNIHANGDVSASGRMANAGLSPTSGYPAGWYGGLHSWDIYSESVVGVGQGGSLTASMWASSGNINANGIVTSQSYFNVPSGGNAFRAANSTFYGDTNNSAIFQPGSVYIQHYLGGPAADIAEVGNIYSTGTVSATNLYASGVVTGAAGVLGGNISIGGQHWGALPYPYETIQMQPGNNLRIAYGSNQVAILDGSGSLQVNGNMTANGSIFSNNNVNANGNITANGYLFAGAAVVAGSGGEALMHGYTVGSVHYNRIRAESNLWGSPYSELLLGSDGSFTWNGTPVALMSGGAFTGAVSAPSLLSTGNTQTNGKFLAAEGSGTNGGYSFTLDGAQDTGMFSPSDGVVDIYNNAVNTLHITPGAVQLNGSLSTTGNIQTNGGVTASGDIRSTGANIYSSYLVAATGTVAVFSANGAASTGSGTIYLRPDGANNGTGQAVLNSNGSLQLSGDLNSGGNIFAAGNFYGTQSVNTQNVYAGTNTAGSPTGYNSNFYSGGIGGWMNLTYGGGWYMSDPSWIRAYNDKSVYTGGQMQAGSMQSNGNINANGTITANGDVVANGAVYSNNWFRSNGNSGWYSQTYGGGWYMTDGSWIRAYNDKGIYTGGQVQAGTVQSNGRLTAGEYVQINGLAAPGGGCSPDGLISRASDGTGILQCKGGLWVGFGGIAATVNVYGASTCGNGSSNVTNITTCPAGYVAINAGRQLLSVNNGGNFWMANIAPDSQWINDAGNSATMIVGGAEGYSCLRQVVTCAR